MWIEKGFVCDSVRAFLNTPTMFFIPESYNREEDLQITTRGKKFGLIPDPKIPIKIFISS